MMPQPAHDAGDLLAGRWPDKLSSATYGPTANMKSCQIMRPFSSQNS